MSARLDWVKDSLVYVALGFLAPAINFFLAPLYTKYLTPEEYSLIFLSNLFGSFLINIISLGLSGAFTRYFFYYYKNPKLLSLLFSTLILTVLAAGTIVFGLLHFTGHYIFELAFANKIFSYTEYGQYVVVTAIFSVIQAVVLIYFRNFERIVSYSIYAVLFFFSTAFAIYMGVVYFEAGAQGSVIGRMFGIAVPTLAFILLFYLKNPIHFSIRLFKQMMGYGINIVPYLLLMLLFNNIDKIIIERKLSLAELGIYSFAFLAAGVMEILINAFQNTFTPKGYRLLGASGSTPELKRLYRFFLWAMLSIIVVAIVLNRPLTLLLINEKYHSITAFLSLLVVSYVPRLYFVVFATPIFYYRKTKLLPVISLVSLSFGLITTLVLVEYYGILGVCVGVVFTRTYQLATCVLFLKRFSIRRDFLNLPFFHSYALLMVAYITLITATESLNYFTEAIIPLLLHLIFTIMFLGNRIMGKKNHGEERDVNEDTIIPGKPLIVAFGGVNQGMGMPVFEFFNMLNEYQVSKMFVRDIQQVWYHRGLVERGGNIEETKEQLRVLIEKASPSKVIFIGNSAGGYAALLFGRWLQVDEVHAFSPQSFIGLGKKALHNDKRWLTQIIRAHLYRKSKRKFFDLKRAFASIPNSKTKFTIYYPKDYQLDALHAERMKELKNLTLKGYSNVGHELISVMKKKGELKEILVNLIKD